MNLERLIVSLSSVMTVRYRCKIPPSETHMECPATKRRKLEGGVFREVEFDKCFTLGRGDFPDLDSDTLKNVSEQHVVLTDASWDHFTDYII